MTVLDAKTAHILRHFLDESRWYPGDDEYPGDPEIHPEKQWRALRRYFDQQINAGVAEAGWPTGKPEPDQDDRIQPLEALALARLIVEGTRAGYWSLVYEARKAGDSWTDIGNALGISRQSAHEMYAKDLDAYAAKMKGKVGADWFTDRRPEYESVLPDTSEK